MKNLNLKFLIALLVGLFTVSNQSWSAEKGKTAKAKTIKRNVQSSGSTPAGRRFYLACYNTQKKTKSKFSDEEVCGCITRILETSALEDWEFSLLTKFYRGVSTKADERDGFELTLEFESTVASACMKNPNATLPIED